MNQRTRIILTAVFWLSLAALAVYRISTPPAAASLAIDPAVQQSIFSQLQSITAQPHPVGSAAHAAVHASLVAAIDRLGLPVQTQELPLSSFTDAPRWAPGGMLRNIMTRVPGNRPGMALLLASHYDSVPGSPGAGDDGAAVASMLQLLAEAARADFANDVIFLFTDAEEICLCGARAFLREHPWADDVGVALNFEARGTSGKSVMFEATPDYGKLVRIYAEHAVHPATSSLYQSVYELLPNDTDLTAFREQGKQGLNMAFIESPENYHTPRDSLEQLNRDTVMHQYANMRAMMLALADADLDDMRAPDVIFFDLFGMVVVAYDYLFAYIGAGAATLLFGFLVYAKLREGQLRALPVAGAAVVLLVAGYVVVAAMSWSSDFLRANVDVIAALNRKAWAMLCIVAGMLIFAELIRLAGRRIGRAAVATGILIFWLLLLIAASVALPKISYIFLWPLLPVLLVKACWPAERKLGNALEMFAYVPLVVIWTQVAYALLVAMSVADMHIIVTPMLLVAALLLTNDATVVSRPEKISKPGAVA